MSGLIFDGHRFDDYFTYGNPDISVLRSNVAYAESDSRNGSVVIGRTWGNSSVAFSLFVEGSLGERREALSTLGAWLDVSEPKKLVLPDTPDRYYMAIPEGALDLTRALDSDMTKVTFTITDPIAYGMERTITVPSGGSVTFNVAGTHNAKPRITANAVRNASALVWGIRLDSGDFVHVKTGSSSACAVDIDCDNRTCLVNNDVSLITLDSDWLEFSPGTHTLNMEYGTGAATVTYVERWL